MLASKPAAVLLLVIVPVIEAVVHRRVPIGVSMMASPTFFALKLVPVDRMVPVGCVITGLAEANDGRATKAVRTRHAAMSLGDIWAFFLWVPSNLKPKGRPEAALGEIQLELAQEEM
jgi:hypothetical protein